MKKIFTIIMLAALSLMAVAQQKKVAVYVTGEQSGISKVLGDQLVAAFAKSGKYAAIERTTSFLAELNKEHGYERSGAVNDNQIAQLGVQFGVNYVCVADMTDAFGEKYISARLIDVETAEVVNTHSVSGEMNSMSVCVQMAGEIANYLTKGTFAEQEKDARIQAEKELEERKIFEENEKKRKELEQRKKLINAGYVDLGLPSGTWWKYSPESTSGIKYSEISNYSAKLLPTPKQMDELLSLCTWIRDGHGFIAVGPNGNKISFPSTFSYKEWGKYHYCGTYVTSQYGTILLFFDSSAKPYIFNDDKFRAYVRFVAVP